MRSGIRRGPVDWGHLAFLAFISVVVIAYLFDARGVSLKINNLLLVEPAAIIALVLVACVLPQCFRRRDAEPSAPAEAPAEDERVKVRHELLRVGALAALLGVFSFFLEQIGFDVATFLFIAIGVVICGERRPLVILAFAAAFTVFVVYGYSTLVPYPFPMRIL
ncbi:tripartite tricarboxylate transporter TctB family protein [Jiella sonneratiae]|uniref:Tripartite tricarboxylate transporter TctB family protein n=1 Tax=Jiella sonneratiae TaxID=2816856 RepID=A0ABS3J9W3_9HYPH|nr:tripartite tricarboxylate transporter TctB family protein [Jiella sonneratiae]MBO0905902.1 tripartite tricarboxylate transporter TctB family protein [Jiella sonneratiae]